MKKVLIGVFVVIMVLCACNNTKPTSDNTDHKVAIATGHSLEQLALEFDSAKTVAATQVEGKYSDDVKINGRYTSLNLKDQDGQFNQVLLQGFYKTDLAKGSVYINGNNYSETVMGKHIVFETDEVVVYNITSFILEDVKQSVAVSIEEKQSEPQPIKQPMKEEVSVIL